MSEPEIWTIKMADHPRDDFVRLSAYKALDIQRAELIVENARLKAEVERLRKAGDVMAEVLSLNDDVFDNQEKKEAQAAWNAAKEGRPNE